MTYPDESAAVSAIDQSKLFGAYIAGASVGTLIVVPAKSFFDQIELEQAFASARAKLKTPFTVQTVKPLPSSDRVGAVVSLFLLPVLIGGYLAAVLLFKATATAAAAWRAAILTGYAPAADGLKLNFNVAAQCNAEPLSGADRAASDPVCTANGLGEQLTCKSCLEKIW